MATTHDLQGLLHEPYGLEHPYEQAPTERFPRDPIAGQPVALGVATWPPGAAQAVWATWALDGGAGEERAEGGWVRDDEERSYWQVLLPAFRREQRVTYRLHARQGDRILSSETFSFVVAGWCSVGDVVQCHLAADSLRLACTSEKPALQPHLVIAFRAPHRLHVRWGAGHGASAGEPGPLQAPSNAPAYPVLEETEARLVVATPDLRVTIHRRPCRLEVSRSDGTPVLQEAEPPAWLVGEDKRALRVRQRFVSPPDEGFYGFGERYNALDQRGNALDVRVFDQYKNQERRTYLPVPFFLSSQGYGLYLATHRHVAYVTHLTGKPTLPPAWAFGPWMSSNEWNSQARVMEQVRKTLEHRIPATVLVIEAWSDEATFYIWNDAQYTPRPADEPFTYSDFTFPPDGRWPDPKGMIEALHRLGIRVLLWQIPVMKKLDEPHPQHDRDEAYMIEKGYWVREANGQPYRIRPLWFHGGLVLDVATPDAVEWWLSKRAYLLDELDVDGFKTDGGEHLWGRDLRFADGQRGDELCNLYPNLYVGAYHRFARKKRQGDAITFSRAGFTGAQAYPHRCLKFYLWGASVILWHDHVIEYTYPVRSTVNSEAQTITIELPAFPLDLTLILRASEPSAVSVNNIRIGGLADLAARPKGVDGGWFYDTGKGCSFVKLPGAEFPRTVALHRCNPV